MNEKLKKLGRYFNRGLKIGVLTTAMMATGVGCVQNTDDAGYEKPTENPEPEKTLDEINQERDQDLDVYIFNRHRFAETTDSSSGGTHEERLALGTQRYNEAQDFMQKKIAEFNQMVANDPNAAWLLSTQPQPGQVTEYLSLDRKRNAAIEASIDCYREDFSKFLAQIQHRIIDDNDYWKFRTCYDKLAVRAYNDSLGKAHDHISLPTFNKDEPEINQELMEYRITNDVNDYHTVENTMQNLLNDVANQTGCRCATLQAAVEMALYNEGLFGLSDLIGKCYVTGDQVYKPPVFVTWNTAKRKRQMLNSHIASELNRIEQTTKATENDLTR